MKGKIKKIRGIFPVTLDRAVFLTGTNKTLKEEIDDIKLFINKIEYSFIDVKSRGAKGDGVTDDSKIIQEIVSNVSDNSIIYFPEGTYIFGSGDKETEICLVLNNKKNIIIMGDGIEKTKLVAHPHTPVKNGMGLINLFLCKNSKIENLELDGNSQERNKLVNGINWGDDSSINSCSNIMINGGYDITLKNIYSHHPVMDCCEIGRHAGGDSPNGEKALIENCEFRYGYRQGISITGFNNGIIRNCKIYDTGKTPNILEGHEGKFIGTSPKSNIDSETYGINNNWLIEGCYFANSYLNLNDGTKDFIIRNCVFENDGISSETPSEGTRTFNILIENNKLLNSYISIFSDGFDFNNNEIIYNKDHNVKWNTFESRIDTVSMMGRAHNTVFRNNKILFNISNEDSEEFTGSAITTSFSAENMLIKDNIFINYKGKINLGNISPSTAIRIYGNTFTNTKNRSGISTVMVSEKNNINKIRESNLFSIPYYILKTFQMPTSYEKSFEIKSVSKANHKIKLCNLPNTNDIFGITLKIVQKLEGDSYTLYGNEGVSPSFIREYIYTGNSFPLDPISITQYSSLKNKLIIPFFGNIIKESDGLYVNIINRTNTRHNMNIKIEFSGCVESGFPDDFHGIIPEDCTITRYFIKEEVPKLLRSSIKVDVGTEYIDEYNDALNVYKCIESGITGDIYKEGQGLGDKSYTIGEEISCGTARFRVERVYREDELKHAKSLELPRSLSTYNFGKYSFISFKKGDTYYNIDNNTLFVYNGKRWDPDLKFETDDIISDEVMEVGM